MKIRNGLKSLIDNTKALKYDLFISYMLFLLIPIISISIFFYNNVYLYIQDEIITSNQMSLEVFNNNVSKVINNSKSIILDIALSKETGNLFLITEGSKKNIYLHQASQKELMEKIALRRAQNFKKIQSIYVYDADDQIILHSPEEYKSNLESFYDKKVLSAVNNEKNFHIISARFPFDDDYQSNNNSVEYTQRFNNINRDKKVITIISSMKNYHSLYNGSIIVNIYEQEINYGDEFERYIILNDNKMISSSFSTKFPISDITYKMEENKGYFFTNINGEKNLVAYTKSPETGLTSIKLKQVSELYYNLNKIKTYIVVICLLIIIIGLVLSYKKSQKLYKPIKSTLEILNIKINNEPFHKQNELTIISKAVNSMIKDINKISKMSEIDKKNMNHKMVLDIFKGRNEPSAEVLEQEYDFYTTMLISIDNYKKFCKSFTRKEQWYYKTLLLNVVEDTTSQYLVSKGAILEKGIVGVIIAGNSDSQDMYYKALEQAIKKLKQQISIIDIFTISIGVGQVYSQDIFIYDTYLEAQEVLKYRVIYGHESVLFTKNYMDKQTVNYDISSKRPHLINYLETKSFDQIYTLINIIVEEIKSSHLINLHRILQIFYIVINDTMVCLENMDIHFEYKDNKFNKIYDQLAEQETIDQIAFIMECYFKELESHINTHVLTEKNHVNKIIEIINDYYSDYDFNIKQLVEKVGISYPHINRILQQNIGVGYNQYITNLRIKKAKELLNSSSLKIEEVAIRVGYYNSQSFTRNFKKLEGITPSEYKKKNKT